MDEACTNVVQHGYADLNSGSIILDLQLTENEICVQITDFGRSFEPSSAPQPDVDASLEKRDLGGFGLFFIYSVMDEVEYEASELGNTLTLRKKLS